jgi:hypothetical protein
MKNSTQNNNATVGNLGNISSNNNLSLGNISSNNTINKNSNILEYGEFEQKVALPDDFKLNEQMKKYATKCGISFNKIEFEFAQFKNNKKEHRVLSFNWVATWQTWCENHNKRVSHLKREPMGENDELCDVYFKKAKEVLKFSSNDNKNDIDLKINIIFARFKNWHIAKGTLNTNWLKAWISWCERANDYEKQNNKTIKAQEKADYKWDFEKAVIISDKIKEWLKKEYDVNWIDFINEYKQFEFKNIGWKTIAHPHLNRVETLLFLNDNKKKNENESINLNTISNKQTGQK